MFGGRVIYVCRGINERGRGTQDVPDYRVWSYLMKKIYVGNLPWSVDESSLRDLFAGIGEVHSATVISDRETGRSRGFGFIEMDDGDADKAISELNGREVDGRELRINEARAREERSGGGGRSRGGGGGDRW